MLSLRVFLLINIFVTLVNCSAQAQDRFTQIEQTLNDLSSSTVPGLKEKVDLAVSGVSIQEFLRGLAESNNLNINIDPGLNFRVYNNFTNEKVVNIILFLVREYDLDIRFVGSIMSFTKYSAPDAIIPEKTINVTYNNFTSLLTLDLQGDPLDKVVKKITQVSKKNVIFSSGLAAQAISVYIQDMPFDNALQKMAYANNLKVVKTGDDFYIIKSMEEGDDETVTNPTINSNKPLQSFPKRTKPSIAPTSGELYVMVSNDSLGHKLISVDAINVPMADALRKVSEEAGINYFLLSDIKGIATTRVLNVLFDDFLTRLFQGTDYTYKKESGGLYVIGDRRLEGLRAHTVFQFQFRTVEGIVESIPSELKKGVEIKEFKNLNSIVLSGQVPQIMELQVFLKQLDRVVPQILIEVIMVDIQKSKSVSTGINARITSDSIATGGSVFPGLDFTFSSKGINDFLSKIGSNNLINLGRVTPNFYLSLKALEANNNVDIRSTPKLSTLNGHTASLLIGRTRYFVNETLNITGTLTPQNTITRQFNEVEANLKIDIQPIVAGDDQVTLTIAVSNSDFTEPPSLNAPPGSTNSEFKSTIRVRNEEMIVLGGLESTSKSDGGQGVPFLSRVPVIKWLFSSRTKSKNRIVQIVFIRPTIVY
jgi:type IV pilus assembly protein PilQ